MLVCIQLSRYNLISAVGAKENSIIRQLLLQKSGYNKLLNIVHGSGKYEFIRLRFEVIQIESVTMLQTRNIIKCSRVIKHRKEEWISIHIRLKLEILNLKFEKEQINVIVQ